MPHAENQTLPDLTSGWRRGVVLQSGWWPHTIHWLNPAGRVLPAKSWGASLQAQAPLHPDRSVNQGTPEIPQDHMLLCSHGQTLPVPSCLEEERYPGSCFHDATHGPALLFFLRKEMNFHVNDYWCWRSHATKHFQSSNVSLCSSLIEADMSSFTIYCWCVLQAAYDFYIRTQMKVISVHMTVWVFNENIIYCIDSEIIFVC